MTRLWHQSSTQHTLLGRIVEQLTGLIILPSPLTPRSELSMRFPGIRVQTDSCQRRTAATAMFSRFSGVSSLRVSLSMWPSRGNITKIAAEMYGGSRLLNIVDHISSPISQISLTRGYHIKYICPNTNCNILGTSTSLPPHCYLGLSQLPSPSPTII